MFTMGAYSTCAPRRSAAPPERSNANASPNPNPNPNPNPTEDRRAAVADGPAAAARATAEQLRAAGLEVPVVTGAGTGDLP